VLVTQAFAGKTTLLDVLAFRKNTGTISGDIVVNGLQATRGLIGHIAGFAEQQDVHMPTATVCFAMNADAPVMARAYSS